MSNFKDTSSEAVKTDVVAYFCKVEKIIKFHSIGCSQLSLKEFKEVIVHEVIHSFLDNETLDNDDNDK